MGIDNGSIGRLETVKRYRQLVPQTVNIDFMRLAVADRAA